MIEYVSLWEPIKDAFQWVRKKYFLKRDEYEEIILKVELDFPYKSGLRGEEMKEGHKFQWPYSKDVEAEKLKGYEVYYKYDDELKKKYKYESKRGCLVLMIKKNN